LKIFEDEILLILLLIENAEINGKGSSVAAV
jgi:hypothetical protein